jgi:carbon storage regulator
MFAQGEARLEVQLSYTLSPAPLLRALAPLLEGTTAAVTSAGGARGTLTLELPASAVDGLMGAVKAGGLDEFAVEVPPSRPGGTGALVLSRRTGEWLAIGDDVVVTIDAVGGKRVRLRIVAPRQVRVMRGELLDDPPGEETVGRRYGIG